MTLKENSASSFNPTSQGFDEVLSRSVESIYVCASKLS